MEWWTETMFDVWSFPLPFRTLFSSWICLAATPEDVCSNDVLTKNMSSCDAWLRMVSSLIRPCTALVPF